MKGYAYERVLENTYREILLCLGSSQCGRSNNRYCKITERGARIMNQIQDTRTSYDALREAIMGLSEEECAEILRVFFTPLLDPSDNMRQ